MAQEIGVVKAGVDFFLREVCGDVRVLFDVRAEILFLEPSLHGVALHPDICCLPQDALVDERCEDALAVNEAAVSAAALCGAGSPLSACPEVSC